MNRETPAAATSLVRLVRFEHGEEEPHRDPPEEVAPRLSVGFVERGDFEVVTERRSDHFSPGMVFVAPPGLRFRCRHAEEFPTDVCLSLEFSDPAAAGEVGATARGPALRGTNRLAYARLRLLSAAGSRHDPLAFESGAVELLAAVAEARGAARARLFRPEQLAWHARRVDRARQMLEEHYAEPMPLSRLAREAGMSLFHFARVFRELTGCSPHRHLTRIRLHHARRLLAAGRSVTETCYDVGFSNLSHFTRQFRRAFGAPPSRLRPRG
jgi:AraC-like DNA-binding protein